MTHTLKPQNPTKSMILFVGDNPEIQGFIVETLANNFNIVTAQNGREGLETLGVFDADLILTEMMMPEMSGDQMIFHIRNDRRFGKIPIILITAKTDTELRNKLLRQGAQDYLIKPFLREELLSRVSNLISLKQVSEELQNKNKELESFRYSVAHDLRAPLRSLDGFSQIILEEHSSELSKELLGYFNRILASAKKMNALIDGLLNISRLSQKDMIWENVDLSKLVTGVTQEFKKSSPTRKAKFNIPVGIESKGDRQLLLLVIQSLLDNAWKYSSKKDIAEITFGVKGNVYFVQDNGAGFDMKYAKKLFEPFARLHSEKDFLGIGIGLATVRRIITRHGGKVWAESNLEKGTTVYFTINGKPEKPTVIGMYENLNF